VEGLQLSEQRLAEPHHFRAGGDVAARYHRLDDSEQRVLGLRRGAEVEGGLQDLLG